MAAHGDELRAEANSQLLHLGRRDDAHGEGLTDPTGKTGIDLLILSMLFSTPSIYAPTANPSRAPPFGSPTPL